MALIKGFSVIEGLKGKLGNVVVQKGQNGEQVVRTYVSEIKNPKTIAQSNQRMKVAPAQYARRAMKDIIDHSFEGVAYGTKSLNHFLSLAMKGNAAPAQLKGDMRFIPGKYQMSVGSLPPITADLSNPTAFILSSLNAQGAATTIAALSALLTAQNSQILEGDRITICYVVKQVIDNSDFYTFKYDRFNVNLSDVSTLPNIGFKAEEGKLVYIPWTDTEGREIAGACFILSRQSGSNWLRSTQSMIVSQSVEDSYFSPSAIENSINSYKTIAKGVYSEWYMNEGETNILRFATTTANQVGPFEDEKNLPIITAIVVNEKVQSTAVFATDNAIIGADGEVAKYYDEQLQEDNILDVRFLNAGIVVLEWKDEYLQYL